MVKIGSPRNIVLIPSAGSGSRMGGPTPKQYQPIAGQAMIEHTLRIFLRHPHIDEVWVLLAPEDTHEFDGCRVLRCGGETRAQTVLNGLCQITASENDWILVHDAARPCLSQDGLDRLLTELQEEAIGGLLAVPVADTLKKADPAQRVAATVDRSALWQAQTPQMFRYGLLVKALEGMTEATDEAQAIERLGHAPRLILGERNNIKVTYPEDTELANLVLQRRAT